MNIFEQTLGLVREGDLLSLHPRVVYKTHDDLGYLVDTVNGAQHLVSAEADNALNLLSKKIMLDDWLKMSGLNYEQSSQVLRFLDSIASLDIARSGWSSIVHSYSWLGLWIRGFRPILPSRRLAGDLRGVVLGSCRSIGLLAILVALTIGTAYGAGILNRSYLTAQLVMLIGVLITTIIHEFVHLSIAKNQEVSSAVVVRGSRIGIVHGGLSLRKELASALLGPISGAGASLLIFLAMAYLNQPWFVLVSSGVLVVFHFLSWLPSYGDGKAIQNIFKDWFSKNLSQDLRSGLHAQDMQSNSNGRSLS